MSMSTTVTLAFEGAPSCVDCQRTGIPVCSHIGFNAEAWVGMSGNRVHVPGLDPAFHHILRSVEISPDRKTVTLVVDTERPPMLELARHLSTLDGPKAMVRTIHADTGETLTEGALDAFLQPGQPVSIGGAPHTVTTVDHPNRHTDHGTVDGGIDWQIATVQPQPEPDPLTLVEA